MKAEFTVKLIDVEDRSVSVSQAGFSNMPFKGVVDTMESAFSAFYEVHKGFPKFPITIRVRKKAVGVEDKEVEAEEVGDKEDKELTCVTCGKTVPLKGGYCFDYGKMEGYCKDCDGSYRASMEWKPPKKSGNPYEAGEWAMEDGKQKWKPKKSGNLMFPNGGNGGKKEKPPMKEVILDRQPAGDEGTKKIIKLDPCPARHIPPLDSCI